MLRTGCPCRELVTTQLAVANSRHGPGQADFVPCAGWAAWHRGLLLAGSRSPEARRHRRAGPQTSSGPKTVAFHTNMLSSLMGLALHPCGTPQDRGVSSAFSEVDVPVMLSVVCPR